MAKRKRGLSELSGVGRNGLVDFTDWRNWVPALIIAVILVIGIYLNYRNLP